MFELHHGGKRPLDVKISVDSSEVEMDLSDHEMVSFKPDLEGLEVETLDGKVWLTQSGDPNDHVLAPHQSFETRSAGSVVIEGLEHAKVRIRKAQSA